MVAFARGEGLAVEQADALSYLERLGESSLGGIFCAEFLTHLAPAQLLRLLELVTRSSGPAGC